MQRFKLWGIGDIIEKEITYPYDGNLEFNHIEATEIDDYKNHITFNRTFRNLYDNDKMIIDSLEKLYALGLSEKNGVFFNSLENGFNLEQSDFFFAEGKYFLRIKPGIAVLNSLFYVNRPTTEIAEKILTDILGLKVENTFPEKIEIHYNYEYDLFHAKILKSIGGVLPQEYLFTNGATFLDFEEGGFNSGIELLIDIINNFPGGNEIYGKLVDLSSLNLEQTFVLPEGSNTNYVIFDENNNLSIRTFPSEESGRNLWYFDIFNGSEYTILNELQDLRTYVSTQNNSFENKLQSSKAIYSSSEELSTIEGRANEDFRVPVDGFVYNFNDDSEFPILEEYENIRIVDKPLVRLSQNSLTAEPGEMAKVAFRNRGENILFWSLINDKNDYKFSFELNERIFLNHHFYYNTDEEGMTISLPLSSEVNYNFYINWGDGSPIENITSHLNNTHTYTTSKRYFISFGGRKIGNLAQEIDVVLF